MEFPYPRDHCPHDTPPQVALTGNTHWVAICPYCGTAWSDTDLEVPRHVLDAVAVAAGMTVVSEIPEGMKQFTIGDLFRPGHTTRTPGMEWYFAEPAPTCVISQDFTTSELADLHGHEGLRVHQPIDFALVTGQHALALAVRVVRSFGWMDSTWQACRQDPTIPVHLPVTPPGRHMPVSEVTVSSSTGRIVGMRTTTWPADFANAVHRAVQGQLDTRSDRLAGDQELAQWMADYPTPARLVGERAELLVRGGRDDVLNLAALRARHTRRRRQE